MGTVLQTDFAWPDTEIERAIIEAKGHKFVVAPPDALTASDIEALVETHDPNAIMACWAPISAAAIRKPTDLRIVQRIGVGLDNISVEEATKRGCWVTNVPDYCVEEVSDHAIALLLSWARGTIAFDRHVKAGRWDPSCAKLRRVADLSVGIIGFGPIARRTLAKLSAFDCKVIVHRASGAAVDGVAVVALEELIETSDVIILQAPLTEATRHLIDADQLSRVKADAFLINVSRGSLVDTEALIKALRDGALGGCALDVLEGEPDPPRELVERDDVIVTPHIAFSSDASLKELRRRSAEEVVRVLEGKVPHHPCNQPAALS